LAAARQLPVSGELPGKEHYFTFPDTRLTEQLAGVRSAAARGELAGMDYFFTADDGSLLPGRRPCNVGYSWVFFEELGDLKCLIEIFVI
jgi:hypothetical protein